MIQQLTRIDSKVSEEVYRVDTIMHELTSKRAWLQSFGVGMSDSEVRNGLKRLSESLRLAHLGALDNTDPLYKGMSEFFQRCDTQEARALNILEIEKIVDNRRKQMRVDAEEGIFFEPQLTDFDPIRYRVLKKTLGKWQGLIPVKSIPVGATDTKYTMWESTGKAGIAAPGLMTGVEYVGVKNERFTNQVTTAKLGYMFTTDDMRKAAFSGEPLMDELLIAAQQTVKTRLDQVAWNGDASLGLEGIINHSGVPNIQAAAPASGTDKSWEGTDKTNDEVFGDINNATSQIAINSFENWQPEDTEFIMIVTRSTKKALNRRMAAGTDTTLIGFIRRNVDVGIKDIVVIPDIEGTGPAGSNQALFYPFDPKVLRYRVNENILWSPMQWVDLAIKVPGEIIHGGVEIIYAVAMIELYDI